MTSTIPEEYARYHAAPVMQMLARAAHGSAYCGQTSSATLEELHVALSRHKLDGDSHVIDLGCGNGCFSVALARTYGCRVTGIDLSSALVTAGQQLKEEHQLGERVTLRDGDFTKDRLADACADTLLSIGSLYWEKNITITLRHWASYARPSALLLILLNAAAKPLSATESDAIGQTQFVPKDMLLTELGAVGFAPEFQNSTQTYIRWLRRWRAAMSEYRERLAHELGSVPGAKLARRFDTYLELAERGAVERLVVFARKHPT